MQDGVFLIPAIYFGQGFISRSEEQTTSYYLGFGKNMSLSKLYEKYCSDKVLGSLTSLKDLNHLIDNYLNDPQWPQELHSSSDDLVCCFEALDSDKSQQNLQHFISLRILYYIVGPVLADALLAKVSAQELLGSWKDKLNLTAPNDLVLDGFESSKVLNNIIALATLKLTGTICLSQKSYHSALDLEVNALSFSMLQKCSINKFIALVDEPSKEQPQSSYKQLERSFKQVKLQKGVLFLKSNCKIFYDAQGNRLVNQRPHYLSHNAGYSTLTLADAINKYKCELLKLNLNDLSSQQLLLTTTHKAIKKHTKELLILINEPFTDHFNLSNFSVDELVKPCTSMVTLIKSMAQHNPQFKPVVQFDSHRPNELALSFC